MDINQIKDAAAQAADEIDIHWDKLENPEYRYEFERVLKHASRFVPELENLYTKINSGSSVAFEGEESPLDFTDREKYSTLIEEELFNGYILQSLYHKYTAIENVMKAALDNEA
jgi:hypothetical protein